MRRQFEIWLRQMRSESGAALVLALGLLAVLLIVSTTLVSYSSSNSRTAVRSKADNLSFSLSEAGLANILSILNNPSNNALDQDILPSSEATASTAVYEGGTAKWWGVLDRSQAVWTVTGVGLFSNPTGGGAQVRRKLSAKVPVYPNNTQPANSPAWNYIYSRGTGSTCDMTLSNNVSGNSRLYVAGNLCLGNNAGVASESLIVQGNLDLGNNASVGSTGTRVETYVGGNCRYGGGAWAACTGNQDARKIFSKLMPSGAVGVNHTAPIVPSPTANLSTWYENSIPGPSQPCTTTTGTPPIFDNNYPTRNNSVTPEFNLTPASSYTCRVGPAGNPSGELSWNSTTKVLTVSGTIYIDGSAKVSNGSITSYNGQATLYLSGTFLVSGKLCGSISGSDCNFSTWNPNTEMLTIVADGNGGQAGTGNSILVDNNSQFQGGLFGTSAVEFTNNSRSDGPIVGSTVKLSNNVQNDQFPTLTVVPVGMPGNPVVYAQPNPPELFSG
jgi:Tfp pilus assembly protein PilX